MGAEQIRYAECPACPAQLDLGVGVGGGGGMGCVQVIGGLVGSKICDFPRGLATAEVSLPI